MVSTLQHLIAPLTEAEFLTLFFERTVAFVRTSEPRRFETLLDWDELNYLVASGLYPAEELRLHASMPIPTSFYVDQGRLDGAALASLLERGGQLIFNRLDRYVPRLFRLCHQIAERTGERVTADAIVMSGMEGARSHVNTDDACVLQIAGSNRWELRSPSTVNPPEDESVGPPAPSAPSFDEILRVGDFLFVPAGCSHRCECGVGRSLHVRIALEPLAGRDVVTWLVSQLATDETFNSPLTRYADANAFASHEAALKARLIEQVQAWSIADFLAERAAARANEGVVRIQGTQDAAASAEA
jgi:ribosomal protein L16 Arg81 hydroxylase